MKKIYIEKFLEFGAVVLVILLIAVVLLQIFSRLFLTSSPSWTEEIARFLFIYAVAFAAPLAIEKNGYVNVEFFFEKLPVSLQSKLFGYFNVI